MKWVSHKILTGVMVYAITGDILLTGAAVGGSVLPDVMEGIPNKLDRRWRRHHRQLSHWPVPYATVFATITFLEHTRNISAFNDGYRLLEMLMFFPTEVRAMIVVHLVSGLALGACLHILQDALCGTVPSLNPRKRFGKELFEVGSLKEYGYVLAISAGMLFIKINNLI